MGTAAYAHAVRITDARLVFITYDQIKPVASGGIGAHQHVVTCRRRQGLRKRDSSLQVIDSVVEGRRQILHGGDDARVLVPHLDAHALGASEYTLVTQVIERAAGT